MTDQLIPQEDISRIDFLDVTADLILSGWNREEIRIKDPGEGVSYEKKKNRLEISGQDEILINIPHNLEVLITSIAGNVNLKGLRGELKIKSISGDLTASDIKTLSADSIGGDLIASRIQGNMQVKNIGGDCLIDNVQGQVEVKNAGGDIQLDSIAGGIDAIAGGSGSIDFHPVPWQAYKLIAGGDLSIVIPADTSAELSIKSGARDITIFPGKLDITCKEEELDHTLGEGGPTIFLTAGGAVFITDDEFTAFTGIKMNLDDLGSFASGFTVKTTDFIRDSLDNLEEDLAKSLSGLSESLKEIDLSEDKLRDLTAKIEETSREAAKKAEIAAIKAQAKVEKRIAKARKKALQAQERIKQFDLNKFLESESEKEAVSNQERVMILEMLQEKKISPEEAEELLNALEGKSR